MSPIPAVDTTGNPAARYSAIFVGEEAILERQGLMNDSPARATASSDLSASGDF